ncbi:hypothetical protein GTR02_04085 [Kineococcus sp. R8]|uniref:hypothetical protein n=1 Tax=Kineococcus siccus TaxID=2696567 RepID=UPI0014135D19|nr:hypothetical protein [Kineococcus siccus]NAZ80993.1 hypothetical protein [Kineococcus siccus]
MSDLVASFLSLCVTLVKLRKGCKAATMALDPVANPYTPRAGQRPALLSGRDQELQDFRARLQRLERGRAAQCTLIVGLSSSAPVGQTCDALIRRGLIYSPRLGYAAFTVPQFDDYLRRHFELEAHVPRRRATEDGDG